MKIKLKKYISVWLIICLCLPFVYPYPRVSADASINDTAGSAAELRVNSTVTGNILSSADANYFKFNLPVPGAVNINFSVSSAIDSGNWTVLLYDQDERLLQMARVGFGGVISESMRSNRLDKQRLPAGDYYIRISPHNTSALNTAEYRLSVDYTPEPSRRFEKKPSNTEETANELSINAPIIGNLNNYEDFSYFKFTAAEFRDIKIEFSTPQSVNRTAWTVYLFDEVGGIATYNLGQSGALTNGRRLFTSELLDLPAGDYYIAVFTYNLSAGAYSNEDYAICVRVDGAPIPLFIDDEPSYLPPTEVPLESYGVNRDLSGHIINETDAQRFNFGLEHSGLIYAVFYSPSSVTRQSWIVNIFDVNGRFIYSGRFGGEPTDTSGMRAGTSNAVRVPAGS